MACNLTGSKSSAGQAGRRGSTAIASSTSSPLTDCTSRLLQRTIERRRLRGQKMAEMLGRGKLDVAPAAPASFSILLPNPRPTLARAGFGARSG